LFCEREFLSLRGKEKKKKHFLVYNIMAKREREREGRERERERERDSENRKK